MDKLKQRIYKHMRKVHPRRRIYDVQITKDVSRIVEFNYLLVDKDDRHRRVYALFDKGE